MHTLTRSIASSLASRNLRLATTCTARKFSTTSFTMADRVHRITQFKLPKHEDQLALIEQYKILNANQKKDGKPYILSCVVGLAEKDPRSQDYTVICKTEFASLDDMKYYDQECEAHKALKAAAKNFTVDGIMTTYFTPKFIGP